MRGGLTWAMLREHRLSYAGLAVVLIAASTLVGSSLILFAAARTSDLEVAGLGSNEVAKLIGLLESGRFISSFMATLGAFVAVLLVSQTMSFVVDGRRRELALLRLAGASRFHTTWMIVRESGVLGVVCSIVGVSLALPAVAPYARILSAQNNWPQGFPVAVHASALIWCVITMTLVAVAGAFAAARRIGRTAPIDAVRAVPAVPRNMPPARWVLAALGLAAVVVFCVLPPHTLNHQIATAGVGAGAVLLVSALAPVVVPAIARVFGGMVALVAPGAGLVAREHTAHDARRTAALATPIIILLGLGSAFGMMAQTGRSDKALGLESLTRTDAAVEFTAEQPIPDTIDDAAALPEVAAITQVQRADDWAWAGPGMPADDYPQLMGVDPDTFTHFVPAQFRAGSIDDVTGTDVAYLPGAGEVGDTFTLEAPDGTPVAVRIAAVVQPTSFVFGTFLVDAGSVPLTVGNTADTWLVESRDDITPELLVDALERATTAGQVFTYREWVDDTVGRSVASQQAAIFTIVGGAAILAVFSLAQSTLASVRARRGELELLTKLGARRRSVVGSVIVESGITAVTASVLAVAVTGLVYARLATALDTVSPSLSPIVPLGLLSVILGLCILVSVLSAAAGALLALLRDRRKRWVR